MMSKTSLPTRARRFIAFLHDAAMAGISFPAALYLRLGEEEIGLAHTYLAKGMLVSVGISMTVFISMRLYRGLWRFASPRDMITILKAVSVAVLLFYTAMFLFTRLESMPRSVVFIHWLLLLLLLVTPRLLYRTIKDRSLQGALTDSPRIPVLLIGASNQAELFLMDMLRRKDAPYQVVGILDNDRDMAGSTMHQVPIYGATDILHVVINKLGRKGKKPQRILLSDTHVNPEELRSLLEKSEALGIPLARLPNLSDFKREGIAQSAVRTIDVEDLLGRAQNVHDRTQMEALVKGKRVLVTGAGGSIGSELARQLAGFEPSQIILLEQSEYALYQIDAEIAGVAPELPRISLLCDVGDAISVERIFAEHQPELVFHAAAIKHVPIAEFNIEETVWTNVFGTRYVADACERHGVSVMVLISTDKAVNPTNVMGAAKRLAETYCQALGQKEGGKTRFVTVRFGNVLGSTGSVVPLFQKQLAKGGPITITHPDIERYFMTVREAVELVIQAAALGRTMDDRREHIFVLDMGKPVKIKDLAVQMIRLAGLIPDEDIKIIYTGLRPGEKLYEELFHLSENVTKTTLPGIMLAAPRKAELNTLEAPLAILRKACADFKPREAKQLLQSLVPEFKPQED